MIPLRRQLLLKVFKVFDLLIMCAAFSFATLATHFQKNGIPFEDFLSMRIKIQNFIMIFALLMIWYLIFHFYNLYESKRLYGQVNEITDILKASFTGTLVIFIASLIFNIEMVNPIFLGVFLTTSSFITILSRLLLRYLLSKLRVQGRNLRYMLIAGTNQRAINFAKKIESRPDLGYRVIGFVDDQWAGLPEFQKTGYRLVTDLDHVTPYLRNHVVDEMAINLPMKSYYEHAEQLVDICQEQGIIVRHFSDIFSLKNGQPELDIIEEESTITIRTGKMVGGQLLIKRFLDIIISFLALLFLTPLFLITTLFIKFTSKGQVFFIQDRVGLNKRIFKMYKFRTMVADAEEKQKMLEKLNEASGPVFKIKNDPRITKIGKLLRKTSIDELPQLLNILKGEMSLVGPRPLPLRDYKGFKEDWHRRRVSVKPGVTCLWQINGRSNMMFEEWMELDMKYIDEWTLWLDINIIFKTVPKVFRGEGAV